MTTWWNDAVLYQIYPRSFADTNGDGIGDLRGITAHLDHLAWLGVDGVWISPTFPSPNADWGYDVSDYLGVHPDLGTLDDLDELVRAASARRIAILLDLVPNHTSIEHPWFVDARSSRDAKHRDWYVWADPAPDGGPPNNWMSTFSGSAWTLDEASGQYYLQNFLPEQADLNWWNDEVRAEFDRILEFWFARDIAGFRIDVAHMIVKDRELRDNPPAGPDDPLLDQVRGQRQVYNSNRPEVHDVHKRWRRNASSYPAPRLLIGETFVERVEEVIPYYGDGDELGLAFDIPFLLAPFEAPVLADIAERMIDGLPPGCAPVWTGSNHDVSRLPTRWADGNPAAARCALVMLLTLPGAAVLYYGDELGMPDTPLTPEQRVDPVSKLFAPVHDRDAARTPMPWSGGPGAGFTTAAAEPWLPFGDVAACNVADQHVDPTSTLHLVRALIALRSGEEELRTGRYQRLALEGTVWAWRRGDSMVVACNLGDAPATVEAGRGHIVLATDRALDTTEVTGPLTLPAWTAVVMRSSVQ